MERKYRALRTIATIFKIVGWIVLVVGILTACGSSGMIVLGGGTSLTSAFGVRGGGDLGLVISLVVALFAFIVTLVTVGLYALLLIAAAEGIHVFLDIEENTRQMARRLAQGGAPGGQAPPS
jgi:hypothetical protein